MDAVSFHIGTNDTVEEILPVIKDNSKEYQTAIVDTNNPAILLELQKIGFRFIECTLSLTATADVVHIPDNLRRFQSQMTYRPASDDEIKMVREIVGNGEIFKNDKISLDPFFGRKKSGIRYSFWIDDLINNGNTLFVITFKDEIIAFEVAGMLKDVVEYYIGGMLPCKTGKMLGAAISVPGTLYWKDRGAKSFKTVVSSNNPSILRVHQSFGFDVTDCKYVLIRHN